MVGYLFAFGVCFSIRGRLTNRLQEQFAQLTSPLPLLIASTVVMAVVVVATVGVTFVFRRFVDRRAWKGMALPPPWQRPGDLWWGLAVGGTMLFAIAAIEYGLGWFHILGRKEGMSAAVVAGLLSAPDLLCWYSRLRGTCVSRVPAAKRGRAISDLARGFDNGSCVWLVAHWGQWIQLAVCARGDLS